MYRRMCRRSVLMCLAAGALLCALPLVYAAVTDTAQRARQTRPPVAAAVTSVPAAQATLSKKTWPVGGRNREVHVAAVSQDRINTSDREAYFKTTMQRLEWAACRNPDIIALPEGFPRRGAEAVPGPTSEEIGQFARKHNCYIIAPYRTIVGERRYNSSVLIDRQGKVVGQYNKAHPTAGEVRWGTTPGTLDPPVFETDFGRVAMQICFDANWPETWKRLKENGAEIVFFSSAYPAHRDMRMHARANEYYIVSSTRFRQSRIYDINGEVIARSGVFQPWADATIHLGKRVFELGGHRGNVRDVEKKYGRRIAVKWYHDDDRFTLASLDPELAVEDIMEEFGLTPLREYIAQQTAAQDAARPQ